MMNTLLVQRFVNRLEGVPWKVVPITLLGLAAILLFLWLLNKILTPFFGEGIIETREDDKNE